MFFLYIHKAQYVTGMYEEKKNRSAENFYFLWPLNVLRYYPFIFK